MGVLLNLTKEYFEDIEREEDKIGLEGVKRVSFTDGNGKFHKNGYRPENRGVLDKLMQVLIGRRGDEGDFNDVDTSLITTMSYLFNNSKFNGDISGWKFPNVRHMNSMFNGATAFNRPIGNWKFPNVIGMSYMFAGATSFNQDIGKWEFPNVNNMSNMFEGATSFDQNISGWNVESVTYTGDMFKNCPIKKKNKPKAIR